MLGKKIASATFSAVLVVSMLPASAIAEEASETIDARAVLDGSAAAEAASAASADDATVANTFTFTDDAASAVSDGSGYSINGTALTITAAGTYVVTGSCAEGFITVKKGVTGVMLVLRDLVLTSSTCAPITCNKSSEVTLQVEGTVAITDAEDPDDEDSEDADVADAFDGAAIKAKSEAILTITGTGTLNVDGSACKNGIKGAATTQLVIGASTSDLVTINVNAANNGIASDGSVVVNGGNIYIAAGNDGIKSEPDEDDTDSQGTITINGGALEIVSTGDGIQATGALVINGGTFDITANGGYANGSTLTDDSDSCKGIKSDTSVTASGGDLDIDAADDGIHSNGDVTLLGGTYAIASGDDGVHADYVLTIGSADSESGPDITIATCVEGLEGATVDFYSGSASITSSDDGINAANSDLAHYSFALNIAGGTVYVNAGGDGLDSNGTLTISGGTATVFGSTSEDDCAVDYGDNSTWTYSGGTIIGIGMANMATVPTSGVYVSFGITAVGDQGGDHGGQGGQIPGGSQSGNVSTSVRLSAGDVVSVRDSSDNEVFSTTAVKTANSVVLCSDAIVSGQTYTLYVNGTAVATATAAGTAVDSGDDGGGAGSEDGDAGTGDGDGEAGGGTDTDADTATVSGSVYRLYNQVTGEHLFTMGANEYNTLPALSNGDWIQEDVAWYAPESGTTAVYRLYNKVSGDHHYTTDVHEVEVLSAGDWTNEGVAFYSAEEEGGTPVYRLYNSGLTVGQHLFTVDANEYATLPSFGWEQESIAWYASR